AVRAEEAHARARGDVEVEVIDRGDLAVALDRPPQANGQLVAHRLRMPAAGSGSLVTGSVAPPRARGLRVVDEHASHGLSPLTVLDDVELDGEPCAASLRS